MVSPPPPLLLLLLLILLLLSSLPPFTTLILTSSNSVLVEDSVNLRRVSFIVLVILLGGVLVLADSILGRSGRRTCRVRNEWRNIFKMTMWRYVMNKISA